jgi:hypothetical protein
MALLGQPAPRPEPKDVLASVREQSCYGTLRSFIYFIFGIVLIFCGVVAIGGIFAIFKSFDVYHSGPLGDANPFVGVAIVLGAILIGFIACAWHQAALAVIDIADLLIAQRADSLEK